MKNQDGQVALVVLLISAVVMTLGLSVSRKVTTETKIDTNEELLKQSFNTAESGIDYFLTTGNTTLEMPDKSKAEVVVNTIGGATKTIEIKNNILPNNKAFFWLRSHDDADNLVSPSYTGNVLEICTKSGFAGSLSLALYYIDAAGFYKVNRDGFNFGTDNVVQNYTANSPGCVDISTLLPSAPTDTSLVLVVSPLFNSTPLTLNGNGNFPIQGREIESTGKTPDGVTRKVTVFSGYALPDFMLEAVSGTNVLSN